MGWALLTLAIAAGPAAPPPPAAAKPPTAAGDDPSAVTRYTANFSTRDVPVEFSDGRIEQTHQGRRPMLGRFGEAGVEFSLENLAPHRAVHVVTDLAILNSWNGSSPIWGSDGWRCTEGEDERPLLDATFSNCGFFNNNDEQSYPDVLPIPAGASPHEAWTGSAEHQTLGEPRRFRGMDPRFAPDCSSVYHLDWTFPHAESTLMLKYTSHFKKDKGLRWGLLGVRVETLASLPQMTDEQMAAAWADLANDADPAKADAALWHLAATGDAATDYYKAHPTAANASPYWPGRVRHLLEAIGTLSAKAAIKADPTLGGNDK